MFWLILLPPEPALQLSTNKNGFRYGTIGNQQLGEKQGKTDYNGWLKMGLIDWIVLGGYLATVALLGVWFAGRQKDAENYFVGGRKMPWWAVGLSLFGSTISTGTFIALPGQGYGCRPA